MESASFFFFFSLSFFIFPRSLGSISRASRAHSRSFKTKKMAHPGADYDPYDGIVSNPNKKKNPLVLVGEREKWIDRTQRRRNDIRRVATTAAATASTTSVSHLFSPLFSLSFTKQKHRNGRHRRRPRCGTYRVPTGTNALLK